MNTRHVWLIAGLALPTGCRDSVTVDYVTASLASGETYTYPTVGGDEDWARISTQPKHFSVSEIRRNAGTNWVITFVYQAASGFVGMDRAEIEIMTGSDGASPPTNVRRVVFTFEVHN